MTTDADPLVARLRAAGCVFAEEEADLLRERAGGVDELEELTGRRLAGESLEQVVGWVDLGDLRLAVGPGVFVPRQRSLLLVAATTAAVRRAASAAPVLVEAYAGVAPIAAAVSRAVPTVRVHAVDLDPVALGYAATNLGPGAGVHRGRGLTPLPRTLQGAVAVITAVPPYVPDAALDLMPREAREHEDPQALLGGRDGLDHVRTLLAEAPPWLARGGHVLCELGAGQWEAAAAAAAAAGYVVTAPPVGEDQTAILEARRS
ncbi:hypothetical protein [Nocardioides insulae]|uniref:hypothetical protein n=1 Tax=Nocardioides insulae TaxID=394734 RepID=UPI000416D352|nr:hypothetical protein [Nocardioides insulae]